MRCVPMATVVLVERHGEGRAPAAEPSTGTDGMGSDLGGLPPVGSASLGIERAVCHQDVVESQPSVPSAEASRGEPSVQGSELAVRSPAGPRGRPSGLAAAALAVVLDCTVVGHREMRVIASVCGVALKDAHYGMFLRAWAAVERISPPWKDAFLALAMRRLRLQIKHWGPGGSLLAPGNIPASCRSQWNAVSVDFRWDFSTMSNMVIALEGKGSPKWPVVRTPLELVHEQPETAVEVVYKRGFRLHRRDAEAVVWRHTVESGAGFFKQVFDLRECAGRSQPGHYCLRVVGHRSRQIRRVELAHACVMDS